MPDCEPLYRAIVWLNRPSLAVAQWPAAVAGLWRALASSLRSLRSLWLFFFAVDRALPVSLRNERIADSPRSRRSGTLVPAFATLRSAHTPTTLLLGGVFRPTDPPPEPADGERGCIPSTTQRGFSEVCPTAPVRIRNVTHHTFPGYTIEFIWILDVILNAMFTIETESL